jgi:prepilin-type N-terminal cleavage/methylation domain-containing protein
MNVKRNPGGFTLVEIMAVIALIGLLAVIMFPNYVRSRNQTQAVICIENLRLIRDAKHQWAVERKKNDSDTPTTADLQAYIRNNLFPQCPVGGIYTIGNMATEPSCSQPGHGLPPH